MNKTEGDRAALKPRSIFAEHSLGEDSRLGKLDHMLRQLFAACIALGLMGAMAAADVTHPSIPKHHAHAAESRSPHAAEKRSPHAAGWHAKPQKPPKHSVAVHPDAPKVSKH